MNMKKDNKGIISESKVKRPAKDKNKSLDKVVCGCDTVVMDRVVCGCDTVTRDRYTSSYTPSCGDCTHGECMCYRD